MLKSLKKEELKELNSKPFSILLFYADGCKYCELVKPIFEDFSEKYPNIMFAKIELKEGDAYYTKYAEQEQEVIYEAEGTDGNTKAIPQFNEDGSPKMVYKYAIPSFYVHHADAISDENPYGFIGGFDGLNEDELRLVCEQIEVYE